MILKLEIESEDAMNLLALHKAVMNNAAINRTKEPEAYDEAKRITKAFYNEVVKKIPPDEVERVCKKNGVEA